MSQRFRLLTEVQVKALLPPGDLVSTMRDALARFSAGEVLQPVRSVMSVGPGGAFFGLMPAYVPAPPRLGAKLVTVFNGNAAKGLPSHLATILLLDPETGALMGLLDGRYITEMRTAAVSAVSVQQLARPNPATLAILGSGVQARSHLGVFAELFPLTNVRVWSPHPASRAQFVQHAVDLISFPVVAMEYADEAIQGADLVVLATSSPTPVVDDSWVSPGAHVVSVGACRPDQREMDPRLLARARLFVDSRAAALVESGDVVQGLRQGAFDETHIRGELGEVVLGRVKGRNTDVEVTVFKSLGMAVEDVTAADLVFRRAVETGTGTELSL